MKFAYMTFLIIVILLSAFVVVSCGDDDDDDDDDADDDDDDGAQSNNPGCCYWAGDEGAVFDSETADSQSECGDMAEEAVNDPDSVAWEYVAENTFCEDESLDPDWWS